MTYLARVRRTAPSGVACCILLASWVTHAKPQVMIDAGHGGSNRGAYGKRIQRYEKRLTLKLAKLIRKSIRKRSSEVAVLLTREHDRYLTLRKRVHMANEARVDAFVSVHLNASEHRDQHGYEAYILSTDAADREALRLASLENTDTDGSLPAVAPSPNKSDIVRILKDMKQRAAHVASLQLARAIHRTLRDARPKAVDRGIKQAPFDVLMGLRMPGVLVEVGFIDHPLEGVQMLGQVAQRRIADAIAKGILDYLASRNVLNKK